MTFKASLATAISEVLKDGKFSAPGRPPSDELQRFIHLLMEKAGKRK